jgi:hypothetical protein
VKLAHLCSIVALGLSAAAQQFGAPPTNATSATSAAAFDGEGPLDNDSFLPVAADAAEALARGDRAFAQLARKTPADPAARAWIDVFEGWRGALASSRTGDIVPPRARAQPGDEPLPWPDPDGTAGADPARRADGVEYAILRRLLALEPAVRAVWTQRFSPLARTALESAADEPSFAAVERSFPATESAVRAALVLCERELERGHVDAARAWLERAQRHTALVVPRSDVLERGVALRARMLDELARPAAAVDVWTSANDMAPRTALMIDESQVRAGQAAGGAAMLAPGTGLRPGMTFLGDERAAVHVPGLNGEERVALVDLARGRRTALFEPRKLEALAATGWRWSYLYRPQQMPGWPLLPVSDGEALVLVIGRQGREGGNVLACIEIEPDPRPDWPPLPRLRWALRDGQRCSRNGELDELGAGAGQRLEFQPGALIRDGRVFVLAREFAPGDATAAVISGRPDAQAEIRTWLIAVDLAGGSTVWKTELGTGVETARERARLMSSATGTSAAQPLAEVGGRIFAGTHTGLGALIDAADGRVAWTLKNRRRAGDRRGWTGARPPVDAARRSVLWAPADSDRLYWLRGEPDLDGRGLFLHRPRAIGSGEVLIGGGADDALVLGRTACERELFAWNANSGATATSPTLAPDEWFGGDGIASAQRALFATNLGLYLLDRARDVLLVDYTGLKLEAPAPQTLGLPGGSLWARGRCVCVLGLSTLWIFEAR